MSRRVVWLVVVLGVIYIGWNYGRPYFRAWRFRDAMTQQARLAGAAEREEMKRSLLESAENLGVPISPRRLTVYRSLRGPVSIAASWQEIVEIGGGPLGTWVDTLDFDFEVTSTRRNGR